MNLSGTLRLSEHIVAKSALIKAGLAQAVDDEGQRAAEMAASLAPVETGFLRDSIHYDRDLPDGGTIHVDAPYAAYVEYGTSRMAPEPYLTPALLQVEQDFVDVAKVRIRKAAG